MAPCQTRQGMPAFGHSVMQMISHQSFATCAKNWPVVWHAGTYVEGVESTPKALLNVICNGKGMDKGCSGAYAGKCHLPTQLQVAD